MLDGNIYFLLKHLTVTALAAGLTGFFGWWLRGLSRTRAADAEALRVRHLTAEIEAHEKRAKTHADELEQLRMQQRTLDPLQPKLDAEIRRAKEAAEETARLRGDLETLRGKTVPHADHLAAQNALAAELSRTADLRAQIASLESATASAERAGQQQQADSARFFGKRVEQDDLKIVEGIGPKVEEILKAGGVTTWRALAAAPSARLREILSTAGARFAIHDPSTWPEQSRMALEGRWEELKKWQDNHSGGLALD